MSERGRLRRSRPPASSKSAASPRASGTGRDAGPQGPTLALVGKRRPRLRLLSPELRPMGEERRQAVVSALRCLYREFLEAGGLDSLRDRRSHAAPNLEERKAA
jgi:hypothetical protein